LLDSEAARGEGRRRGRPGGRIGAGKGRVLVGSGRVSAPTGGGGGSGGWVAGVGRRQTLGPPPCGSSARGTRRTARGTRRFDWRRRRKWRMGHQSRAAAPRQTLGPPPGGSTAQGTIPRSGTPYRYGPGGSTGLTSFSPSTSTSGTAGCKAGKGKGLACRATGVGNRGDRGGELTRRFD
jgi:hypothetical protein